MDHMIANKCVQKPGRLFTRSKKRVKTFTALYKGNRTIELFDELAIPKDTRVLVIIPEQDDETDIRRHLQDAAEDVLAKLWDNEEDEVRNEYL